MTTIKKFVCRDLEEKAVGIKKYFMVEIQSF